MVKIFTLIFTNRGITYSQHAHSVNITHFKKILIFFLEFRNILGG